MTEVKPADNEKRFYLWIILSLTLAGILSAGYLFKTYYLDAKAGKIINSACDIGSTLNCTTVNTSSYAKLLNTPFSFLGILYLAGLLWLTIRGLKNSKDENILSLFLYSLFGLLFIPYFVYAEIVLGSICLLCTVVHIAILFSSLFSYLLLEEKLPYYLNRRKIIKTQAVNAIISVGAASIISIVLFNIF